VRHREDIGQELWIFDKCTECVIVGRGLFPRITTAGEVDKNNPQSPNIVLASGIRTHTFEDAAVALYKDAGEYVYNSRQRRLTGTHVIGASTAKVLGDRIVSSESEIGQQDPASRVHAQDIYHILERRKDSMPRTHSLA